MTEIEIISTGVVQLMIYPIIVEVTVLKGIGEPGHPVILEVVRIPLVIIEADRAV